jgi:ATP-dependent exoDNAse (exonuclease V) alpha subunit
MPGERTARAQRRWSGRVAGGDPDAEGRGPCRERERRREFSRLAVDPRGDLPGRLDGEARRMVAEGREWAIGDRLLCRRNDYRLDVRNGTRGLVTGLDEREGALTVWTDDGREVRLPADYLRHAEHGYAMTGHVSQGTTVDRAYLLATPERGGREWAYVAGSRQRIDLEVYAVHHEPERLEEALARIIR